MNLNLRGKRALVCGASQGIGRAVAINLASLGAEVCLLARNGERLAELCAELTKNDSQEHSYVLVDLMKQEQIHKALLAIQAQGKVIHILVNNSGGPKPGFAEAAPASEYLAAFTQHLLGAQTLVQALVPGMRQAGFGRIVNILSTSVKQAIPKLGVSNCIRAAVANWAKTLAGELGPEGITVNNVLPGATETARLQELYEARAQREGIDVSEVIRKEKEKIPLGRFAKPEETAAAVAFLASPAAAYINGINLPVDGGRTACL